MGMGFSKQTRAWLWGIGTAGTFCAFSAPAQAEKSTMAESLFDKGIQLMEQEKYERACPYLEESYRRDPLLGALIALADCEYERGRIATALKRYEEYVNRHENLAESARQKQGNRLKEARARVEELKSSVPTIKVTIPDDTKTPILHLDGNRIKPDEAYPVEPGKYEVTLDVFGRATSRIIVETRKGQKKIVPMDLGKTLPPKIRAADWGPRIDDAGFVVQEPSNQRWAVGITLMSLGLGGYLSVYLTAGAGLPGSLTSLGLGAGLTFSGAILTLPTTVKTGATQEAIILPLVQVGTTPDKPTVLGFQGRF